MGVRGSIIPLIRLLSMGTATGLVKTGRNAPEYPKDNGPMDGHIAMVEAVWLAQSPTSTEGEEDLAEVRAVIDSLMLTP